jgi:hypothetical protein
LPSHLGLSIAFELLFHIFNRIYDCVCPCLSTSMFLFSKLMIARLTLKLADSHSYYSLASWHIVRFQSWWRFSVDCGRCSRRDCTDSCHHRSTLIAIHTSRKHLCLCAHFSRQHCCAVHHRRPISSHSHPSRADRTAAGCSLQRPISCDDSGITASVARNHHPAANNNCCPGRKSSRLDADSCWCFVRDLVSWRCW